MTFLRTIRMSAFEAVLMVVARPRILVAGALAAGLGIGLLVAMSTIASTAQRRVSSSFDVLRATTVVLTPSAVVDDLETWMPTDYDPRLAEVSGIVASNRLFDFGDALVATTFVDSPAQGRQVPIVGIDPDAGDPFGMSVVGASLPSGDHSSSRFALVGERIASTLDVADVDGVRSVFVGGRGFVVAGIISSVDRIPRLLDSIVIDAAQGAATVGPPLDVRVVVEAAPGAAASIGELSPIAVRPDDPIAVDAATPPDPGEFRGVIEDQLSTAIFAIGAAALCVAAAGIGVAMASAVRSRVREIGLRRAIGARWSDIFAQFLFEALMIGVAGGLVGVSLGVVGGVTTTRMLGWNPVLDPSAVGWGLILGTAAGGISGIVPAINAARVLPARALRAQE